MTILLDESAPRLIKKQLPQLAISTVQDMGWTGLKNGELLKRAEERFEVFVTADKKIRYQQNLSNRRLAIVVLPSNQVPVVTTLSPVIERPLTTVQPGAFVEIPLSLVS